MLQDTMPSSALYLCRFSSRHLPCGSPLEAKRLALVSFERFELDCNSYSRNALLYLRPSKRLRGKLSCAAWSDGYLQSSNLDRRFIVRVNRCGRRRHFHGQLNRSSRHQNRPSLQLWFCRGHGSRYSFLPPEALRLVSYLA